MTEEKADLYISDTVQIVCAYAQGNVVSTADLLTFIPRLYETVSQLGQATVPVPAPLKREPAVPVNKSITEDYIVCLEDGKKFKSMKKHLKLLGMTPDEYRVKWRLPPDYPIVAPSYSSRRSALAKASGLGTKAP